MRGMKITTTTTLAHPLRLAPLVCAALLAACGGGDDSSSPFVDPPTVSSTNVGTAMYSQTALVTINGAHLDAGLSVSSAGCSDMTRSMTAPNVSSDTTAYYTCTVSAVGAQTVTVSRSSDNTVLGSANFNVNQPQVTMTVDNGLTGPAQVSGSMLLALQADKAPITVMNFLAYVNSGFYVGTTFHRVVPGFVIQGGGMLANGTPKTPTLAPIALETSGGLSNVEFSLAMARTSDPNSATSQFFVNLADNSSALDPGGASGPDGYAVFGSVSGDTSLVGAISGASPCDLALPNSECAPTVAVVITAAQQTQ